MTNKKKVLVTLIPIYLYFYIEGFYAVIYKENPIARILAVISMLIFTILITLFISTVFDPSKQNKNGKLK